jgi:hypothetical protein
LGTLPSGWAAHWDANYEAYYFVDPQGASTWYDPRIPKEEFEAASDSVSAEAASAEQDQKKEKEGENKEAEAAGKQQQGMFLLPGSGADIKRMVRMLFNYGGRHLPTYPPTLSLCTHAFGWLCFLGLTHATDR